MHFGGDSIELYSTRRGLCSVLGLDKCLGLEYACGRFMALISVGIKAQKYNELSRHHRFFNHQHQPNLRKLLIENHIGFAVFNYFSES